MMNTQSPIQQLLDTDFKPFSHPTLLFSIVGTHFNSRFRKPPQIPGEGVPVPERIGMITNYVARMKQKAARADGETIDEEMA